MPRSLRVIRLFISSTFADMQRERTLLQIRVFPIIKKQCADNGWRFEAIDLRWGITAEQTANNITLDICLAEVERCRDISPRPNLLILCGQRYGWIPMPDTLPSLLFDRLVATYPDCRDAFENCYLLDYNSIEPKRVLRPSSQTDPSMLAECEKCIVDYASHNTEFKRQFWCSATESEIKTGLFDNPDTYDSTILYCRRLNGIPEADTPLFIQESERQETLKLRLRNRVDNNLILDVDTSFASYDNGEIDNFFVDEMTRVIGDTARREMERFASLDVFNEECMLQSLETSLRATNCVADACSADMVIDAFAHNRVTIIEGSPLNDSGAIVARIFNTLSDAVLLNVAISRRSVTGVDLLRSLLFILSGERDEASDIVELSRKLRLALSAPETKISYIAFTNVDKLAADDEFFSFLWFPALVAAPGLKLILCAEDEPATGLNHCRLSAALIRLPGISSDYIHDAIIKRLAACGRRLTPQQSGYLLRVLQNAASPLPQMFDIIVSSMASLHSWDTTPELPADPEQALSLFWTSLTDPLHNHPLFSRLALALLLYMPSGITDDELLGILALDEELFGQLNNSFGHEIVSTDQSPSIPFALWPGLYHQLSAVMVCGRSSNGVYNTLYNNIVSQSLERFLGPSFKKRVLSLALDYFSMPRRLHTSRSVELRPWLLKNLGLHDRLFELLTNDTFCNDKIAASMVELLLTDFLQAAESTPQPQKRNCLLDRHSFVKSECTTLQLYCPMASLTFARQYERYRSEGNTTVGSCKISHTRLVRQNGWRLSTCSSTRLLVVDNEDTVAYCTIYDIDTMKTVASIDIPLPIIDNYPNTPEFRVEVKHVALSDNGNLAAILGGSGLVVCWNTDDGTVESRFVLGTDNMACHPVSPVFLGNTLCFYAANRWNRGGRVFIGDITVDDTESITSNEKLYPGNDNTTLYAVGQYGDHLVIDISTGTPVVTFREIDVRSKGELRGDWHFLAYDRQSGNLYVRRNDYPAPIGIFNLPAATVSPCLIAQDLDDYTSSAWVSPRCNLLVICDQQNYMRLYNLEDGKLITRLYTHDTEQLTLVSSIPDETFIAQGHSLILWRFVQSPLNDTQPHFSSTTDSDFFSKL